MPAGLNHAAAVAYRGSVYVVGGYRGRRTLDDEVATLYRYQPRARPLDAADARRRPRRGALAAAVIGHRLYAVGGAATGRGALATLEVYDFRTRRWSAGPDLPLAARAPRRARPPRGQLLRARRPRRRAAATSRASTATTRRAAAGRACAT